MADNWYIVLELEFDPPVEDEYVIEQRINEKAKFWSTHFNDFKNGAQYRKWYHSIPQIKREMLGNRNMRKQLAYDACNIVYEPIDKIIKLINQYGSVSVEEAKKISKKYGLQFEKIQERVNALGIEIIEKSPIIKVRNDSDTYEVYYNLRRKDYSQYKAIDQILDTFNADNLYDFLFNGTSSKNVNKLPCEVLRQLCKNRKKNEFFKIDQFSSLGRKICDSCELIFKDEVTKNSYDQYLQVKKTQAILEELKTVFEICSCLPDTLVEESIYYLANEWNNIKIAEGILRDYCNKYEITLTQIDSETIKTKIKKVKN